MIIIMQRWGSPNMDEQIGSHKDNLRPGLSGYSKHDQSRIVRGGDRFRHEYI